MSNFAEYTRLRDIAQKRIKRLGAAGLMHEIHIPTVREIRAGIVEKSTALRELKDFLSGGSTVQAVRQTGLLPTFKDYPALPKPEPLTELQRKERKRERQRWYRQRKKIRETSITPEKARKYEGYLKALDTVSKAWKKSGFNIGIDLKSLSPSEAQAFVEYMEYRFAQGDFTQRYVIDEFIQDFSKLLSRGHKPAEITADFDRFLAQRAALSGRSDSMTGLSSWEVMGLWDQYIEGTIEELE